MLENRNILEILKDIEDPATGSTLLQTNRVADVRVDGTTVHVILQYPLPLPGPQKMELMQKIETSIAQNHPDVDVHIHFETQRGGQQSGQNAGPLPQVKNVIAIASGKGGVGKSTVSSNLAVALKKRGHAVGLLDADFYGPSIPKMFGLVGEKPMIRQVGGKHKLIPLESFGIHIMSIGFIVDQEQAVVLRGPRLAGIMKQFIHDCIWPTLDYLIIDLPPGTGDIQLTMVQTIPVTGAIIVTTPQEVSVADAIKALNMFLLPNIRVPILGVVENMSWFTPAELPDNKYFLFGQGGGAMLAKKSKSTLIGQIPIIQSVMEGGDHGTPSVISNIHGEGPIFDELAQNVERQVALRNELYGPTQTVQINQ